MTAGPRTGGLGARLRERIAREGPISFAAFMEAALYDPAGGFYARGQRLGEGGAFSTAPTRHAWFARAVAAEALACRTALGQPADFALIEVGPGDGALARSLAARLAGEGVRLVLVERAAGMARAQRAALADAPLPVRFASRVEEVSVEHGFVVANELFDDQPVHLLAWPDEILVGVDAEGRFVEVRRAADPALLELVTASGADPRADARYAVCPSAPALLRALAGAVSRGRLLVVDYGGEVAEAHSGRGCPVRTYVGGRPGGSPLEAPGAQNLTADVDFGLLRRAAGSSGLRELRFGPLGSWLRDLGAEVGAPERRSPEDWVLAGLLGQELPFRVLLLEKARAE